MCELDDLGNRFNLAVFPEADVFGCDAALGCDTRGFDTGYTWPSLDDT